MWVISRGVKRWRRRGLGVCEPDFPREDYSLKMREDEGVPYSD